MSSYGRTFFPNIYVTERCRVYLKIISYKHEREFNGFLDEIGEVLNMNYFLQRIFPQKKERNEMK